MQLTPQFFDIFGILAFLIILAIGVIIKFRRRKLPNNVFDWIAIVLIAIGVLGFLIDLFIVITSYF